MMNSKKWLATLSTAALLAGTIASGVPAFAHAKPASQKHATTNAKAATKSAKPATKNANSGVVVVTTQMVTGKMDGRKGWPQYKPSTFHVLAGKTIKLVIKSYDDGFAPVAPSFTKVQGTIGGSELVDGKKFTSFKADQVAHTMTITDGNKTINVVVPVRSAKEKYVTVTAEFSFAKPGTYSWQCMAACGTGKSGWGGPMVTNNWMKGTWVVGK